MSQKIQGFIDLLQREQIHRDELEMGTYVPWLRRRNPILCNLETKHVIEVIRNAKHDSFQHDDVIFRQGTSRDSERPLQIYIILRGSASLFNNPFMSQGLTSRRSSYSFERLLLSSALEKSKGHPKSATSKSTGTRLSPITHLGEDEDDVDVDENVFDIINEAETENEENKIGGNEKTDGADRDGDVNNIAQPCNSPASRISKRSRTSVRSKLGNFVVKYEKGIYMSEEALLNDDDMYTGSVIVDEQTDAMVLDEHTFDKYIKEHHEKDALDLTDYVDYHPFFCDLPIQSRGLIQISLKKHHHEAGTFIIKQGEPVKGLKFIISGSAEILIEPGKHRYQYPEFWPFETSTDVYYKEFDWLRESRRRVYEQSYQFHGEVTKKRHTKGSADRKAISVCAVLDKEVIGITEALLNMKTYLQGYRCIHPCDVYSLNLKPFRRVLRRNGSLNELVLAYIKMKLQYRIANSLGEKVPLLNSLLFSLEKEANEKSYNGVVTPSIEKIKERELELMKALEWFKRDKGPLINNKDPSVQQLKENMKEKARVRKSVFEHTTVKPYFRRGCLRAVKPRREPMSLHKLRNPMNEVLLRLRMEGTFIESEKELEEILLRYSETPVDRFGNISRQQQRVIDEEYNLFRYRRYGNQLVRKFSNMLEHKRSARDHTSLCDTDNQHVMSRTENESPDEFERAVSRFTKRTTKSFASTYRPLQFDRRSVTPGTIEMRVKQFNEKYDGQNEEGTHPPELARYDTEHVEPECAPLPGGKVFVTKVPCVSCNRNILLKNHTHLRCQMLQALPMDKFDRRSVTPGTIEMRVKQFNEKYGGQNEEGTHPPELARYDTEHVEPESAPLPGGKVFVTKVPCVSCNRNILLKDHTHLRCQMLQALPMEKVRGYNTDKYVCHLVSMIQCMLQSSRNKGLCNTDNQHVMSRTENESPDEFERAVSRFTKRTTKSFASTYRPLQFDRRSVTPGTIEMRVKQFNEKYGGQNEEGTHPPELARYDTEHVEPECAPLPGGKVFVTKVPCVSCNRNILLKNHIHLRCQMLQALPMDKVRGYNTDK